MPPQVRRLPGRHLPRRLLRGAVHDGGRVVGRRDVTLPQKPRRSTGRWAKALAMDVHQRSPIVHESQNGGAAAEVADVEGAKIAGRRGSRRSAGPRGLHGRQMLLQWPYGTRACRRHGGVDRQAECSIPLPPSPLLSVRIYNASPRCSARYDTRTSLGPLLESGTAPGPSCGEGHDTARRRRLEASRFPYAPSGARSKMASASS